MIVPQTSPRPVYKAPTPMPPRPGQPIAPRPGQPIAEPQPLFKKLDPEIIEAEEARLGA